MIELKHELRTPGEEISFTALPKINSQSQSFILSATLAQIFRFLWFMPSLGVRSSWVKVRWKHEMKCIYNQESFWFIGTNDALNTQPFISLSFFILRVYACILWFWISGGVEVVFPLPSNFCRSLYISKLFFSLLSELMKNGDIVSLELQPW